MPQQKTLGEPHELGAEGESMKLVSEFKERICYDDLFVRFSKHTAHVQFSFVK